MSDITEESTKKKNRKRKSKISFDEEVVTKSKADELKQDVIASIESSQKKPKKYKRNKHQNKEDATSNGREEVTESTTKSKKKKKRQAGTEEKSEINDEAEATTPAKKNKTEDEEVGDGTQEELDPKNPEIKKTESIRALKRAKHAQLILDKKNKSELKMQQKCLNYLSQWKYNKDGWKFQKLLQIWLQQNMFDDARVPDKFWDTLVEYFNNSKGKSRDLIIKDAVKVIEQFDTESSEDKECSVKYDRARAIVQHLQE